MNNKNFGDKSFGNDSFRDWFQEIERKAELMKDEVGDNPIDLANEIFERCRMANSPFMLIDTIGLAVFMHTGCDYVESRKIFELLFKRTYIEQESFETLEAIIKEKEKKFPNEQIIQKLRDKMENMPFDVEPSPLDDVTTLDDFFKLTGKPKEEDTKERGIDEAE